MRLFVDITAHGWGHLAQTVPIVEMLRSEVPSLELVVRSGLPKEVLCDRLGELAAIHSSETDFGVVMESPFAVDRFATLERYRAVHADLEQHVMGVAELIQREECDLVFSNIGYIALAAARRAEIPSVACSSLDWGGVFRLYCASLPGADAIADEIDRAYAGADVFVQLLPSMTIDRWPTVNVDRAIARFGTPHRQALAERLDLKPGDVAALLAFGGMLPDRLPLQLVGIPGLRLISPDAWSADGFTPLGALGLPYQDVLASVDLVVAKPGYGIVVELGCLGTPSVMVSRGDWPEEEAHLAWLGRHAAVQRVSSLDAVTAADLLSLAAQPANQPVARAGGEASVADIIRSIALRAMLRT